MSAQGSLPGRSVLRFWPHLLVVAFLHLGYHRAQFSAQERERLYNRFLRDPVGASLADPVAALRLHHLRDGDEALYLSWAELMLGKPADLEFLRAESDLEIPLLPFHPVAPGQRLLPYRDFVFQYPTLAVVPIVLPALITTDPVLYPFAFGTIAGLAALVIAIAGWRIRSQLATNPNNTESRYLWSSAAALFLVGVTLETRLDVFAAALVAVALWAAVTDRGALAGTLLGAGAALKIYPALLLPALVAPLIAQRRIRDALRTAMAFLAAVFVPFALPALVHWSGFFHIFQLLVSRGLQVESVAATAVAWTDVFQGSSLQTDRLFGARYLVGPATGWVSSACTLLVPALASVGALLSFRAARERHDEQTLQQVLFDGLATSLAGVWIASPVLSPQYLVWGLPVFLFVSSPTARWLYLFALAVTRIEYPACYPFIAHLTIGGLVLLTIRNALLVATWIVLLRSWSRLLRRKPDSRLAANQTPPSTTTVAPFI